MLILICVLFEFDLICKRSGWQAETSAFTWGDKTVAYFHKDDLC